MSGRWNPFFCLRVSQENGQEHWKCVQQRAGHKAPQMTLAVYSHVAKNKQSIVAEKLDSMIFSTVNE